MRTVRNPGNAFAEERNSAAMMARQDLTSEQLIRTQFMRAVIRGTTASDLAWVLASVDGPCSEATSSHGIHAIEPGQVCHAIDCWWARGPAPGAGAAARPVAHPTGRRWARQQRPAAQSGRGWPTVNARRRQLVGVIALPPLTANHPRRNGTSNRSRPLVLPLTLLECARCGMWRSAQEAVCRQCVRSKLRLTHADARRNLMALNCTQGVTGLDLLQTITLGHT
jgi:hypothetical protein